MIRAKIWADPVFVRLLYLYVRPISRTFLRLFVRSFVICPKPRVLVRFSRCFTVLLTNDDSRVRVLYRTIIFLQGLGEQKRTKYKINGTATTAIEKSNPNRPAKSRLPYSYQEHEQGEQQRQPRDSHQLPQTVPSFSLQSVCSIRPQLFSVFMSVVFMSVVVTATVRHPVRELFYSYSTRTTRTRTVLFRNSPQYGTRANTGTVLVRVLVCSIPA